MRAILFPGQGAQFVGMGKDFFDAHEEARAIYARADAALGFELSRLCFEGPKDRLDATDACQPAILVTSLAILEVLRSRRGLESGEFEAALGLSLGEYTALVFAGALALEDAVLLVRERGLAMQEASTQNPSGMLTVLGASDEQIERVLSAGREAGVLVAANHLAPGQVALSGSLAAIERAESAAKEAGIRRAVRLKVAGAFHSSLMASAAERLRRALDRVVLKRPAVPVIANVTARPASDPGEIRELLARQLTSPVMWWPSITGLIAGGASYFLEPGPGKVSAGIVERNGGAGVTAVSVDKVADLERYEPQSGVAAS